MYATLKVAFGRYTGGITLLAFTSILSAFFEALTLGLLVPLLQAVTSPTGTFRSHLKFLPNPLTLTVRDLVAVCLSAILARLVLQFLCAWQSARITTAYECDRGRELFESFVDADWTIQAREKGGRLQLLMVEHIGRGKSALRALANGTVAACNFLILFVSAFFIDLAGALILAAVAVALFLATRPLARYARRLAFQKMHFNAELSGEVNQSVRLAREVRVFNAGGALKQVTSRLMENIRRSRFRWSFADSILPSLYQNAVGVIVVGGLGVVWATGGGRLGALSAIALLLVRALNYSQTFQTIHHHVTEAVPYLDQLAKHESEYRAAAVDDSGEELKSIERIEFRDVSFAYNPPARTMKNLTFAIPRGEAVGIAGPSGSGKSTLIQLFLRLRRPMDGSIEVNGRPLESWTLTSWFERVAYVPQEPQLIAGTIADNIAFYRAGVSRERIQGAARMAGIHDEIAALAGGYDADVGEAGANLSGGQRQRICIARALAGEPDLIIFDEPTSALDVHSEAKIQESLAGLKGRVTLLIVAHRLSTLSICDRVMVLKEGAIASFAPGEELERTDPYYGDAMRLARRGATT